MRLESGTGDAAMDVLAFPGHDITGTTSSPPLVDCGYHAQLGGTVYLTMQQVVDVVHAAAPGLRPLDRDAIASNIGALSPSQADELYAEISRQNARIDELEAGVSVTVAEVFDFAEEKARIELAREQAKAPVA